MLPDERLVCLGCLMHLPRINDWTDGNEAEKRLWCQIPFEHGASFCHYTSQTVAVKIILRAKYGDMPWLEGEFARLFVQDLRQASSPWPYDIDCIIPIPVHWLRLLHRGYNQTSAIAEVLGEEWQLPVYEDCLRKKRYTKSQVGLPHAERIENVSDSFEVNHPERLQGCHILLVDDVLTSGATIVAAYEALRKAVSQFRVSFLTLALAMG